MICVHSSYCPLIFVQEIQPPSEPSSVDDKTVTTSSSDASLPELPNKEVNKRIALLSTVAALGLFLSTRLDFGVSLGDLTALALPYEEVCRLCLHLCALYVATC